MGQLHVHGWGPTWRQLAMHAAGMHGCRALRQSSMGLAASLGKAGGAWCILHDACCEHLRCAAVWVAGVARSHLHHVPSDGVHLRACCHCMPSKICPHYARHVCSLHQLGA